MYVRYEDVCVGARGCACARVKYQPRAALPKAQREEGGGKGSKKPLFCLSSARKRKRSILREAKENTF